MLPDLEQLISLQHLENAAAAARERIAALPAEQDTLNHRVTARRTELERAETRLSNQRTARAAIEKDVAAVQARLSRYKDQLMGVKTNKEYHAMQSEIANAEREVRELEDQLLERMMEADDLSQAIADAQQQLAAEEQAASEARSLLESERTELEQQLTTFSKERRDVIGRISADALALFETVAKGRKGVAVVEASHGLCTACQVRLRPQLFNNVRTNTALIQCENCQRILYFAEHRHSNTGAAPTAGAPPEA